MDNKIYKEFLREARQHINTIKVNVPAHRSSAKHIYSFSGKSFSQQLGIWDYIWHHADEFWVKVHAIFFLERHMKKTDSLKQMWPVVRKWQDKIDDWPLCDALAKIYTKILVVEPAKVYPTLKQWNKDDDLWKRRQSVVSLLYFSRTKKEYLAFDKIETLVTSLLNDKEYYVQKGVGWTLREMYTVYPKQTSSYLIVNIKSINSLAFTIAIEKMNADARDKLKSLRKLK
jgi:3-methyladenine DNA glycosylase AlkD